MGVGRYVPRMRKILSVLPVLLLLLPRPAQAWLEVEGSWWFMQPAGEVALGVDGLAGTTVDLEKDLGYGGRVGVPDVRVVLGKYVEFGGEFFQFNMSGQNVISREIRFHDQVYPVNSDVATKLDVTFIRGFARLNIGPDEVHGGLFVGGQYMDFAAQASSSLLGSAQQQVRTGMPYYGGFLEISPVEWLAVRGSVCGSQWNFSGVKARFLDVEVGALLKWEWIYAGGGWRHIAIDA